MSAYYVDESRHTVPPSSEWPDLTIDRLLDVRAYYENLAYELRAKPHYVTPLNVAIERLNRLISARLAPSSPPAQS
jgi:hypothetical protein